jgi:photosystem II stability/assembly factor-like uncharacterized protein
MDELNSREKRITDKSLNSIFFANSYDGWVVGDKGTIFHTEDQGGSWRRQISGTKENLEAIACTNERHCWAVGKNGLILSTDNRGNLWKKIESGIFADLFAISFVNNKVGWIAGEDGFILHTTDAGESWEKQRAIIMLFPDGPFAAPTNLQAIKFINENQGWVAGAGGIAYTVDAGKTWQVEHLEETFIGLVSTDKNTVWAVSDAGTNYMTKVGGSPWLPVSSQRISAK